MNAEIETLEGKIHSALDEKIAIWKTLWWRHRLIAYTLTFLSIALSAAITIAGIYDKGTLAAVLGAILAGLLAIQQTFSFSETTFFYRVGIAEAEILKLDLDIKADTLEEVETLEVQVETLIRKMAQDVPRGSAVHDVVQNMREEVRDASQ